MPSNQDQGTPQIPERQIQINYQLLNLYIDTIPNFNGDSNTLGIFLEHCPC